MKHLYSTILIFILAMGFFSKLFGNNEPSNDPYWEFDESRHFKPKVEKGRFFSLTDFEFGWFILEPLSTYIGGREQELEKGKCLSFGQKALYYWWYLDGQVTNGGFTQFYFNGYGEYVPTIIKGLEYVGDTEMVDLIRRADKIYQKNKKHIEKARGKDLFDTDLYDRLEELGDLGYEYYDTNGNTMGIIEQYIKENPSEFCLDQDGNEFDLNGTEECQTQFPNGKPKEHFFLEKGKISGVYTSFYEEGGKKSEAEYLNGDKTGESKTYYKNGNLKLRISILEEKGVFKKEKFYDNGHPSQLEFRTIKDDDRKGEYKEWYENGQLSEIGTYISSYRREGSWLEFYPDASKKEEAEFKDNKKLIHNFWNEKGELLIENGNGKFIRYDEEDDELFEAEYKNAQKNGVAKRYKGDVLISYYEYVDNELNGFYRTYYDNGVLEKEIIYKDGEKVKEKKFDKFKKPKIKATILFDITNETLSNLKLEEVDTHPVSINAEELADNLNIDLSFFEGYPQDYNLGYKYWLGIDEKGNVISKKFMVADNARIIEQVENSIDQLKFNPAMKNGKATPSFLHVRYRFILAEGNN